MNAVETVERGQITQRPAIKPGDTVKVHVKVREGDKERIQVFEGMVIGMHRGGARTAKVRRAKLYFLRDLKGKAARMKETGKKQAS